MASAPCLFITPLQHKENTPARASRAHTCTPFGQTAPYLSRMCFLSIWGTQQRCCRPPVPRVVFHPGRRQSQKAQEWHFKEFDIKAVHNRAAGAGVGQGPDPTAAPCPPSLQAAASPGHRRWKLLPPPFPKVSVLLSTVWGVAQNRQRAQLDAALLNTKGINNPAGDESSFSPRMPRAQIAFL